MPRRKIQFDYPDFTAKVVEFLLAEFSSDFMLKWQQEMDNDPHTTGPKWRRATNERNDV